METTSNSERASHKKGFYYDVSFRRFAFRLNVVMLVLFTPFQSQAPEIKPFKRKLVLERWGTEKQEEKKMKLKNEAKKNRKRIKPP